MTKVAVTGATGFVGRHVLAELVARGLDIVATTRGSCADLPRLQGVEWRTLDLSNSSADVFETLGQPDVLIHLAWGGLPNYRALHHFEVELPQHYAFLRQMTDAGLKSMLVAGTCLEYGLRSGALDEAMPAEPTTPYGFAKDALRRQLQYLQRSRDESFRLTWARLFFMYGDGQANTSLLPLLKQAVAQGRPRFRMSGGEQLRDYLRVTDVASRLVTLALKDEDIGVVNVCAGVPRSVRGLVEQWLREHDWRIELELGHYPYPDYEPMAFWGDRRKLDRVLETQ